LTDSLEAGFLASGSTSFSFGLPRIFETRVALVRLRERLAGYSGGTAQVFDLLPFYPPFMEAP